MVKIYIVFLFIFLFVIYGLFIYKTPLKNSYYPDKNYLSLSRIPSSDKFHIFLIWRGDSFPFIYQKAFKTVVKFHPNAEIMLFSNELKEDWFS